MKKRIFDFVFLTLSTTILVVLSENNLIEKHQGFALIPILIAYFLGKYAERTFKSVKDDETTS